MLFRIAISGCALFLSIGTASAQWRNPASGGGWRTGSGSGLGRSYPEVIGPTGRPYGPTQAAYQYQLQYGRPWRNGEGLQYVNGFPGGGFGPGGGWGGGWGGSPFIAPIIDPSVIAPQPFLSIPSTAYYNSGYAPGFYPPASVGVVNQGPLPLQPIPSDAQFQSGFHPGNTAYPAQPSPAVVEPSTPAQQQTSIQLQAEGDVQLKQLGYLAASERFRRAIDAARDRADPRYHLAVTLLGRSRFLEAVDQLKLVVALDPQWPSHAESLDEVLGHQNALEKVRIEHRVVEWVQQDIRDPNRLFLMAVVMFLDGDSRSSIVIDSAIQIAGPEPHLLAFKQPAKQPADLNPPQPPPIPVEPPKPAQPAVPPPPVPQPPQTSLPSAQPTPAVPNSQGNPPVEIPMPPPPASDLPIPKPAPVTPAASETGEIGPILPARS